MPWTIRTTGGVCDEDVDDADFLVEDDLAGTPIFK
jgi:hypothetical protein